MHEDILLHVTNDDELKVHTQPTSAEDRIFFLLESLRCRLLIFEEQQCQGVLFVVENFHTFNRMVRKKLPQFLLGDVGWQIANIQFLFVV